MSDFRTIMKEGWHPKARDGGKESWRSDFKGINQVAGWMGKGKDSSSEKSEHTSTPLSSLKDPASFGPPPKHVKYHGPSALPNETTPDRSGLDAPLRQEQIYQQQQHQAEIEAREAEEQAAEEERRAAPPAPYRVNTTGLRTDHLPPPPKRVGSSISGSSASSGNSNSRPPPSLPPRLPPRTNSTPVQSPPAYSPIPQPGLGPASEGYVNQGATSRLANAGVSVPALGVGGENQDRQSTASPGGAPVNELQSRFSQMRTGSSYSRPAPPPPPGRGTSTPAQDNPPASGSGGVRSTISNFRDQHADKIDAGKQKMSNFREQHADKIDAGKQKMGNFREQHSDKIDAGKEKMGNFREQNADKIDTGKQKMGNFREQHADKIDTGKEKMGNFREQHADKIDAGKQKMSGLSKRIGSFVEGQRSQPSERPAPPPPRASASTPSTSNAGVESIAKKKPPPPPPKRADIRASSVQTAPSPSGPPPLPLSSKPRIV
ncbi:hypothetical protein SI65_02769 [Aspergillus cristatus]|uniref:Uncharacterized protein n=1 Tax=Aspergillus cristatus TaxID=573508 RepID=A0A1E3BLT7_ASPCR|nr:hypothetical protein SI65_02769 [Aspergillus cristatus]